MSVNDPSADCPSLKYPPPTISQCAENALLLCFEPVIDPPHFGYVCRWSQGLSARFASLIVDQVVAYCSIHLLFNPSQISGQQLQAAIVEHFFADPVGILPMQPLGDPSQTLDIPVYYGPSVALDMPQLQAASGLGVDDIIHQHSSTVYTIYAMGFAPAFAYMGTVAPAIACARHQAPRARVPAGSVAIADQQTAIYPSDSPGGWQVVGRTPLQIVDRQASTLSVFTVGQTVRFIPITQAEYQQLDGKPLDMASSWKALI